MCSSIHPNQIEAINNDLENDRMVRWVYSVNDLTSILFYIFYSKGTVWY